MDELTPYSQELTLKISRIRAVLQPVQLGSLNFPSPLLLAPMAGICSIPFRLTLEELGAGATISELISCHGINHGNDRTLNMLKIHKKEENVGLQIFGEDPQAMATAAQRMEQEKPLFIDINMGCPVRKVVTKGGGSALLQEPKKLKEFFSTVKNALNIPLTIKIRTGWDEESINADEVIQVAKETGIEWVAIHGRTRAQQYQGSANWDYLEKIASDSPLPIIGNGDLHQAQHVADRLKQTNCAALMIARGALRNPFIFLEPYTLLHPELSDIKFSGDDYWEVIRRLAFYTSQTFSRDRVQLVQMRKFITWFAAGFPKAAIFRNLVFNETKTLEQALGYAQDYFCSLTPRDYKQLPPGPFMNSGHG